MKNTVLTAMVCALMTGAASATVIEDWQMNDADGTVLKNLNNSAGSIGWDRTSDWTHTTNSVDDVGARVLRFNEGTGSFVQESTPSLGITTGIYEVEYKLTDVVWDTGLGSGQINVGVEVKNAGGVDTLFYSNIQQGGGRVRLQVWDRVGAKQTFNLFDVENAGGTNITVRSVFDLDANTVDVFTTLGAAGEVHAVLGYTIGDFTFDSLSLVGATGSGSWDPGDYVELDYLTLSVIPEPATIGMLGLGGILAVLLRRFRRVRS